jgi:hypothetical protein
MTLPWRAAIPPLTFALIVAIRFAWLATSTAGRTEAESPERTVSPRLLVGPVGFLRTLLTFACLALPLIWLQNSYDPGIGALVPHLGYGILYFVWVFKVLGRFADSGRTSNLYWLPFCLAASATSALPLWIGLINRYEALALFLVVQTPLALLPGKHRLKKPTPAQLVERDYKSRLAREGKNTEPNRMGPVPFLCGVVIIAALCGLLLYMQSGSRDPIVRWFARCGYFVLACAWFMTAAARFSDAGWDVEWRDTQYGLVIVAASLMPLAVHWVNVYGALVIFVLVQVPTVFLRSKQAAEGESADALKSSA